MDARERVGRGRRGRLLGQGEAHEAGGGPEVFDALHHQFPVAHLVRVDDAAHGGQVNLLTNEVGELQLTFTLVVDVVVVGLVLLFHGARGRIGGHEAVGDVDVGAVQADVGVVGLSHGLVVRLEHLTAHLDELDDGVHAFEGVGLAVEEVLAELVLHFELELDVLQGCAIGGGRVSGIDGGLDGFDGGAVLRDGELDAGDHLIGGEGLAVHVVDGVFVIDGLRLVGLCRLRSLRERADPEEEGKTQGDVLQHWSVLLGSLTSWRGHRRC